MGPKFTLFLTEGFFFCKFHLSDFCLPIMSYYGAKFQKIRSSESWDNSLLNFWTELPQITHLLQKKIFLKLLLMWLLSTYLALLRCNVLKKVVRAGPEILACVRFKQSWAKRGFFLKTSFIWLLSTYYTLHTAKIKKKS